MEIFEAVRKGNEDEVARLLAADPRLLTAAKEMEGYYAPCGNRSWRREKLPLLTWAARLGQLGVVHILVNNPTRPEMNERGVVSGRTALHFAAANGHTKVVDILLSMGARADIRDKEGNTPLMVASAHGNMGMVSAMIKGHEGIIDYKDQAGRTALHYAAQQGHEAVVNGLLDQGAQADILDKAGITPLMAAARERRLSVVQRLLQHGGDVGLDKRDTLGWTALHHAALRGHGGLVKALLTARADPFITDNHGRTARVLAQSALRPRRRCIEAFEWWDELELERRNTLQHAMSIYDAFMTHQVAPSAPLPTCLQARVAEGRALPRVEMPLPHPHETRQEEEMRVVLDYVVTHLDHALFVELMHNFDRPAVEDSTSSIPAVGAQIDLADAQT